MVSRMQSRSRIGQVVLVQRRLVLHPKPSEASPDEERREKFDSLRSFEGAAACAIPDYWITGSPTLPFSSARL